MCWWWCIPPIARPKVVSEGQLIREFYETEAKKAQEEAS